MRPRQVLKFLTFVTLLSFIVFVPPLVCFYLATTKNWITFKTPWEWLLAVLAVNGPWIAICWALFDLYKRLVSPAPAKQAQENYRRVETTPDFPYEIVTANELSSRITALAQADIPYIHRQPSIAYDELLQTMYSAKHLLILGRTGLGKTREAIEYIRRLEVRKGEEFTILLPDGALDVPLIIPANKLKRNIILFIDNLPSYYAEPYRIEALNDPKIIEADFRQRFEQTVRYFSRYYGTKFRVVATAIGEPELRDRLQLQEPFWEDFKILELPELAFEQRLELINVLEGYLGIEVKPEAKALLAQRSDGTFSGLIVPLLKDKSKRLITESEANKYQCVYPQEWEQEVYASHFAPNVYRRNLLTALNVLRQVNFEPLEEIVVDLAARLISNELLFWHKWRVRKSLHELGDWLRIVEGRVYCPDAYLNNKGDVSLAQKELLSTVFHFAHKKKYLFGLRPSLYELINVLLYQFNDPHNAIIINKWILKQNPQDARAWNRLALIYVSENLYDEAERACLKSIELADHANSWLTLAEIRSAQGAYAESIDCCREAIQRDNLRAYSWCQLCIKLDKAGRLDEAIAAGLEAVKLDPHNPFTHNCLGIAYDRIGRTDDAIASCKKAVELDSQSAIAWQTLGVTYSKARLFDDAVQACTKATTLNPESINAWKILSITLSNAGRYDEAIPVCEHITELQPNNADSWSILGVALDVANRFEEAKAALEKGIELDGNNAGIWVRYGITLSHLDLKQRALEAFQTAIDIAPTFLRAWRLLGGVAKELDLDDVAINANLQVANLQPENVRAWRRLGTLLSKVKRRDKALGALVKNVEANPASALAWFSLNTFYDATNQPERALEASLKLVELRPDDSEVWSYLGISYSKLGRPEEAIAALKKAVELNPANHLAWQSLIIANGVSDQPEQALEASLKLVELKPEDAEVWSYLGTSYSKLGRQEEAAAALKKAVELNPDSVSDLLSLGACYSELDKPEQALEVSLKLVGLKPEDAEVWSYLGISYSKLGRHEEAVAALKKAVELNPANHLAWQSLAVENNLHGQPEQALEASFKLVELRPDDPEVWYGLSIGYSKTGRYEDEIQALIKTLELEPLYMPALKNLVIIYSRRGEREKAINLLNPRIEFIQQAELWHLLGSIYNYAGDIAMARSSILKATELEPANGTYWYGLATSYRKAGDMEKAADTYLQVVKVGSRKYMRRAIEKIIDLKADSPPSSIYRLLIDAWKALQSNRFEEACNNLNLIVAMDGDCAGAWFLLALSYKAVGKDEMALSAARHVADLSGIDKDELNTSLKWPEGGF